MVQGEYHDCIDPPSSFSTFRATKNIITTFYKQKESKIVVRKKGKTDGVPLSQSNYLCSREIKRDFNKQLAREGINQSAFLIFSTYQWVKEMEQNIREGKVKKVPTRYVRRKRKEPMAEIQVAMSETLKKRLDHCLEYTSKTRNELWMNWIQEFIKQGEAMEKCKVCG